MAFFFKFHVFLYYIQTGVARLIATKLKNTIFAVFATGPAIIISQANK